MPFNKDEIKNSLSLEQVYDFIVDLGGEPLMKEDYFISRTICHNPPGTGSYKLYYYNNTKLFRCFTDCGDTFDLFQLVCKIKTLTHEYKIIYNKQGQQEQREWQLYDAVQYVAKYFGIANKNLDFSEQQSLLHDWEVLNKYDENNLVRQQQIVDLKVFDDTILKYLPHPIIVPWEEEGIKREIIKKCGIAYNPASQGIIIPHYDINNNLIGIRERTLITDREKNGKYMPAVLNFKMYNHPLSFNLYNLNNSKENIKTFKKAIIGEGEKFTLMYASYFGTENDISVACCGSSLVWYQIQLLLSLGVNEIIIAFDKQFQEIGDKEFKQWVKKLTDIYKKYNKFVKISFMFDKWNLLDYKMSPIDNGKDVFIELYNKRFSLEDKI